MLEYRRRLPHFQPVHVFVFSPSVMVQLFRIGRWIVAQMGRIAARIAQAIQVGEAERHGAAQETPLPAPMRWQPFLAGRVLKIVARLNFGPWWSAAGQAKPPALPQVYFERSAKCRNSSTAPLGAAASAPVRRWFNASSHIAPRRWRLESRCSSNARSA
jgi:hypothetical protein